MAKLIFDRRLLLVTGKGGVGKTTIALALAVAGRDRGLKVLLVQLGKVDHVGPLFGAHIPLYKDLQLEPNLHTLTIEPYLALHEYLVGQIKLQFVADWFLENRVIQYLTQAAPGWRELITIGKIWQVSELTVGYNKRRKYDLIVVDAPATGHGISFLRVPSIILNTLKFGPVRQHTLAVQKLLLDPDRTLLIGVTLPEEMAVNEVIEIHQAARKILQIPYGATVVNSFTRPLADRAVKPNLNKLLTDEKALEALNRAMPAGKAPLLEALRLREVKAELAQRYLEQVRDQIGGNVLTVPRLPLAELDREAIGKIAAVLNEQIEGRKL